MKIHFRQTGGFAGLTLGCDLDTSAMPVGEAKALERLVRDSLITESIAHKNEEGRDLTNYEITIERDQGTLTATFDDMSLPKNLEALVDFLRTRVRPMPLQ